MKHQPKLFSFCPVARTLSGYISLRRTFPVDASDCDCSFIPGFILPVLRYGYLTTLDGHGAYMTSLATIPEVLPTSIVEFKAYSPMAPAPLGESLSTAILGCGGWFLQRGQSCRETLSCLVEFECERALDIYAALVDLGIQLSRNAHISLTKLCQCSRHPACLECLPIARVRITVQTGMYPPSAELTQTRRCPGR